MTQPSQPCPPGFMAVMIYERDNWDNRAWRKSCIAYLDVGQFCGAKLNPYIQVRIIDRDDLTGSRLPEYIHPAFPTERMREVFNRRAHAPRTWLKTA